MQKTAIATALIILFISGFFLAATASADLQSGVKRGDWIEYQVAITGGLEGHNAKWARMEVYDADGPVLLLNVTTQFTNSSYLIENVTLNLEMGKLGDDFFIPANMDVGDVFYDVHAGNITISVTTQKTYVGAQRTTLSATVPVPDRPGEYTDFVWDKQTGILLQAYTNYPDLNFTMHTVVDRTNIWQTQTNLPIPEVYLAITAAAIAIVAVAVVLLWRRRRS